MRTGLANLLASQKDNIARALPAGFSKYLGGTGILAASSSIQSMGVARRRQLPDPQGLVTLHLRRRGLRHGRELRLRSSARRFRARGRGNRRAPPGTGFVPSLEETAVTPPPAKIETPVASGSNSAVPEEPTSGTGSSTGVRPRSGARPFQALENLRGIKVGDVDIGAQLASAVTDMRSSLTSIQDTTSAQAAVAPLTSSASEFAQSYQASRSAFT